MSQNALNLRADTRLEIDTEDFWMILRYVVNECSETHYLVLALSVDLLDNNPKLFQRLDAVIMVAECNIKLTVPSRCSFALRTRTECAELDLATIEA